MVHLNTKILITIRVAPKRKSKKGPYSDLPSFLATEGKKRLKRTAIPPKKANITNPLSSLILSSVSARSPILSHSHVLLYLKRNSFGTVVSSIVDSFLDISPQDVAVVAKALRALF
jgi:hypothetical protein